MEIFANILKTIGYTVSKVLVFYMYFGTLINETYSLLNGLQQWCIVFSVEKQSFKIVVIVILPECVC